MSIVKPDSIIYTVISGEHKGRTCVIRAESDNDRSVKVIFSDDPTGNKLVRVGTGTLAPLETPGWKEGNNQPACSLQEYLNGCRGDGSNMIRDSGVAQPWGMIAGDVLVTKEVVRGQLRRGYNSSVLVCLSQTGWVELAPRLPIAMVNNKKFKFPIELRKGDKLVTGCRVVKSSVSTQAGWTIIYLDRIDCAIDVPSCIPLALA